MNNINGPLETRVLSIRTVHYQYKYYHCKLICLSITGMNLSTDDQ